MNLPTHITLFVVCRAYAICYSDDIHNATSGISGIREIVAHVELKPTAFSKNKFK